jgi:flagellar hook-basal body complex protein FliE
MLTDAIDRVNEQQVEANSKVESFLRGDDVSTHEVMIQLSKADTTVRLMTAVTNKVVEAYHEIARMQI